MSKIKAVVLEKSGSRYTVLGENGAFRHVHRRQNAEVGEEIEIKTGLEGSRGLRMWAGIAAMFLLVLTTLFGWNLYQAPTAVALVSVDINPSIQFTLDAGGHLIKIATKNKDAELLLSKLDLKGKPIDKALGEIVIEAYKQKFLNSQHPWVVVGYSPLVNDTLEQLPQDLGENQIESWVTELGEGNGFTPRVQFFALTPQERDLAQKGKLTLGEYALYQTAKKAGVVTQPEKLRDTSERVRLLEDPKVRAQVKKDKRGVESSSPFKAPIPGLDKDRNKDKNNNKDNNNPQHKKQGNVFKNGNDKEKEIGNEKDKGIGVERETEEEKGNGKGQERKATQMQMNFRDKLKNNHGNIPSFLRIGKSSQITSKHLSLQNDKKDKSKNAKD